MEEKNQLNYSANVEEKKYRICISTLENWHSDNGWNRVFHSWYDVDNIRYCKLESHKDYLFMAFHIPGKKERRRSLKFALFMKKDMIVIIGKDKETYSSLKEIVNPLLKKKADIGEFLYLFLQSFLENDLLFIEKIERKISKLEEDILDGTINNLSSHLLKIKKMIARFYHYYSQLLEMGQELIANKDNMFSKEEVEKFQIYAEKIERLASETKLLREYSMQVQEVYHSEIEIRQNNVMKVLTIVTTIFLPLSLVAGWYGMNFKYMPELDNKYGYPLVICICIIIVVICLKVFRKKNFW